MSDCPIATCDEMLLLLLGSSLALLPAVPPARLAQSPSMSISPPSRRAVLLGASAAAALALPPAAHAASGMYSPAAGSLTGTTILITGANTGLGLESAKRLAAGGARIVVTARSQKKAEEAAAAVRAGAGIAAANVVAVQIDLADLKSVRSTPQRLEAALGGSQPIDCLINNAGVMAIPERLETADGFERTVGVNHLGHFALVSALLPSLKRAPKGFRIINVSSDAHKLASSQSLTSALDADLNPAEYSQWGQYSTSKAANILFTVELQKRLDAAGIPGSVVSVHPGMVQTDLTRYIIGGAAAGDTRLSETVEPPTGIGKALKEKLLDKLIQPIEEGASTQIYLAAGADTGGKLAQRSPSMYYAEMKPDTPVSAATDASLAKRLWEVSERLTGAKMGI